MPITRHIGLTRILSVATLFATSFCVFAFADPAPGTCSNACFRARPGTEVSSRDGGLTVVRSLGTYGWPGVEIRPDETGGFWDWSNVGEVKVCVSNGSDRAEQIYAAVLGSGADLGTAPTRSSRVPAHAVRTIVVPIADDAYSTDEPVSLETMAGKIPAAKDRIDYGRSGVDVWIRRTDSQPGEFAVLGVETAHPARIPQVIPAADFFPFVDKYGQFRHGDWPGKIHADEDFATQRAEEDAWLAAHPGSPTPDVDEYGGWTGGPQLEATGFFRTEKVDGKWWFVDPKGHLFFSLGIDCLYAGTETKVTGRTHYFEELPGFGHGIYTPPDTTNRMMSFICWNLERKYGENFKPLFAENIHRRFKAWGINTLGNWAHDYVWTLRRTPYAATINFSSNVRNPAWTNGRGRLVPDVNSPQFEIDVRRQAEALAAKMRDDPWCLGIFVDNELGWQGWQGGDGENVGDIAEKYYSTVRAVLKEVLPNHLYLGSRIHFAPESVWLASARHCDVVSNNFYEHEPSYDLPAEAPDKPIIIGEFHFGAKDRGFLTGGCVTVFDQKERGECFKHYVRACLDNPRYVGCHWFQYQDQPVSGRGLDGENYNDGFVTMCDVPYPEMVEATREVAAELYTRRFFNR